MSASNKKQQKSKSKSGSKKEGKPKAKKSSKKARQIPIKTDEQSSEHVQLLSDVEIKSYVADQEKEPEDAKYSKPTEIKQKYWDEVEMKHHGLVDDHAHHKELQQEKPQSKSKVPTLYENKNVSAAANFPSHLPYDEIAMKQSGFVDNHCHHMTEQEIDHEDGKQDNRHVEFPSILSSASVASEVEESDQSKSEAEPNLEPRHLKMESKVDTIEVEVGEEEKYKNKERAPMGAPGHLPWDELELKEHGLVDKQGHHKVLPEDEVQLHRKGKIDEHGRAKSPDISTPSEPRPVHLLFDELAMKQSGYLDDHCHHLTEQELKKKRTPVSDQKHVDTDNISIQTSTLSSRETPRSTPNAVSEQKSLQRPVPQNESIDSKGKSKHSNRRPYKLKLKGTLNVVESGSNKEQPQSSSSERKKQQEEPIKAESDQKQTQLSSDTPNKDAEKKSPKREPAILSQRPSKKGRPKSKGSKRKPRSQPPESQSSTDATKVEQTKPVEIKNKEKPKESLTDAQANKDTRKKLPKRDPGKSSSRKSSKKRPKSKSSKDIPRSQLPEKQPDFALATVEDQRESAGKKDKDVGPTELEKKPSTRRKSKREKSIPKQGDE